ncbi:hypothetical protein CVT24_003136 [Panaeolus cyanescens]|uniref:SnoaL-like domain-containing protein n=1 Tax=Panaeolus cyanescens TaxID=181874 RepID=A0A409WT51_9AGAR|nr:hypothetical protein CVT24_003136 [Panaeolus cyanescens]
MSTEETKRIALEWIKLVDESQFDKLKALAVPGANWWVNGLTSKASMAGDALYTTRIDNLASFRTTLKSLELTTRDIIVEGNTAILETDVLGTSHDGKVYRNNVMMKFVMDSTSEEGNLKIREIREYVDLLAMFEFLGITI